MGMNKYDRLFHILNLLRTRRNLNAQKLAEECGVTERSIYRDIISLSEANVPIYYDNGYKLASDNFLPALNFSFDEYRLIRLALESSPLIKTDKYGDAYKRVKAKVETCLTNRIIKEHRFSPQTTHVDIAYAQEAEKGELFYGKIEHAITTCHSLTMTYDSIQSGSKVRKVDPYFIVFKGRAFYFVGFCHLRGEFRTFRIGRVADLDLTSDTFVRQDHVTPDEYFEGSWSIYSGEPVEVVVEFKGSAARVVSTTTHHPGEEIEPLGDGRVRYTVVTRGIEEIQRWILGFGDEAEVISPQEMRRNLLEIGRFLSGRYS